MTVSIRKTILITCTASGKGRETAIAFAEKGANVSISDADKHRLLETAKLIDEIIRIKGRLDRACNNAWAGGELDVTGGYIVEEEVLFIPGHKLPVYGGKSARQNT